MDRRILGYYRRELQHLRETAAEFAREYPKIAERLGLENQPNEKCPDPYVERLLEGFAFLAARVQLKLDAEFPRFTQAMLETVYPSYLAPTPSMAVVRFQPDLSEGSIPEGFTVPRASALRSTIGRGEQTACEYRTAHEVTLWPIEVVEAAYYTRNLAAVSPPSSVPGARAAVRVRLRAGGGLTFKDITTDSLTFYLHGADDTPARVYEQLIAHHMAVVVQPCRSPLPWQHVAPAPSVERVGFADDEALLPTDARNFHGYRLLHEYFAMPQRFLFAELRGLRDGFKRCDQTEIDVVVLLDQADLDLENSLDASTFQLFCTPAINAFPKRTDRIHVTDRFSEFHVVPDRTRPLDYEVYQVLGVTGYGVNLDQPTEFRPFYSARDEDTGVGRGAFFAISRVPRTASERERRFGGRSSYPGSEVYVTLVDAAAAPYPADVRQLGVETICTNRDIPLRMPVGKGPTDFTPEEGAPVESIRVVAGPTPPKPSLAEGEFAWRAVSHLSLNYLSLSDADEAQGASALRDLLKLYGEGGDASIRKQIDGVRTVKTRPIMRRVSTPGPIAFARGLEVTVALEETNFEGTGVFVLGAVLERFFAKYVSINSFTETVIRSTERGEVTRWPARLGHRRTI